ncbi:MAG: LytR C-terminal domain-containing protein [Acidimicrobiia bacterium]
MTATLSMPFAAPTSRIRTTLLTAARGAALIGAAVLVGIVLLQVVDNPTGGGGGSSDVPETSTATDGGNGNGNPDGQDNNGAPAPADVSVVVLNASGIAGAAQMQSDALTAAGYNALLPADAPGLQDGVTVACKPNFEPATQPLIDAIGQGATAAAFPDPVPLGAENADCIVLLGTVTS